MANKVGYPLGTSGYLTDVDTAARNVMGTRNFDDAGNEYIYLQGIGSTVIGSCVTYGLSATPFLTALSVTGARGAVGIAMAAVLATQFGWYLIFGFGQALYNGAAVAGAVLCSASTGKVDDAAVTGDRIDGAIASATVSGAVLGGIFVQYPAMNGFGA